MSTCADEHEKLALEAMGTVLLGDFNCHQKKWLNYSSRDTKQGSHMQHLAAQMGLRQVVHSPTRGRYLLDLVLTDISGATTKVLPRIADHSLVEVVLPFKAPEMVHIQREVWKFQSADWVKLRAVLEGEDWSFLEREDAETGAVRLMEMFLAHAETCIQKKVLHENKINTPLVE